MDGKIQQYYIVFNNNCELQFFEDQNSKNNQKQSKFTLILDSSWYYTTVDNDRLLNFKQWRKVLYNQGEQGKKKGILIGEYYTKKDVKAKIILYSREENVYEKVTDYFFYRLYQKNFSQSYKTIKKLGTGASATVYLVQNRVSKKFYASKQFSKKSMTTQDNMLEDKFNSIHYEMKLMCQMDHPNIMKIIQIFQDEEKIYLVLEVNEGGTLDSYINAQKKKLLKSDIVKIMKQLCQGIQHMHDRGVMHRDLKFDNILVKNTDTLDKITIADMGLSTEIKLENYLHRRVGTPGFIAPEIFNCKEGYPMYNEQCDVFSLGAIFHILVVKKAVFQSQNGEELFQENYKCQIDFESNTYSNLSKNERDLIYKMLLRDPFERIKICDILKHPYFQDENSESQNSNSQQLIQDQQSTKNLTNNIVNSKQLCQEFFKSQNAKFKLRKLKQQLLQQQDSFVLPNSTILKGKDITDSVKLNQKNMVSLFLESQQSIQSQNSYDNLNPLKQIQKKQMRNLGYSRSKTKKHTNSSFYSEYMRNQSSKSNSGEDDDSDRYSCYSDNLIVQKYKRSSQKKTTTESLFSQQKRKIFQQDNCYQQEDNQDQNQQQCSDIEQYTPQQLQQQRIESSDLENLSSDNLSENINTTFTRNQNRKGLTQFCNKSQFQRNIQKQNTLGPKIQNQSFEGKNNMMDQKYIEDEDLI